MAADVANKSGLSLGEVSKAMDHLMPASASRNLSVAGGSVSGSKNSGRGSASGATAHGRPSKFARDLRGPANKVASTDSKELLK